MQTDTTAQPGPDRIEIGDIVCLNSGGPEMKVTGVAKVLVAEFKGVKGHIQCDYFRPETLTKISPTN
jgi:uncharacterized protein YodC (DUF2158 family)